jgi:hypothetical protein
MTPSMNPHFDMPTEALSAPALAGEPIEFIIFTYTSTLQNPLTFKLGLMINAIE